MKLQTRQELEKTKDLLNKIYEPGELKHTEEDDTIRQCVQALIGIEVEEDDFILDVCREVNERIEKLDLFTRDTIIPPDSEDPPDTWRNSEISGIFSSLPPDEIA